MPKKPIQFATAIVLSSAAMAYGQYTGTSHPDEVIITTSSDSSVQSQPFNTGPRPGAASSSSSQTVVAIAAPSANWNPRPSVVPAAAPGSVAPADVEPAQTAATGLADVPQSRQDWNGDSGVVTRVEGLSNRLPEGTLIRTRLQETLSTRVTQEGTEWTAEILEPVTRDGKVLLPAGSIIHGKVTEVHGGKRLYGQAAIHLTTLSVTLPDGSSRGIHAQVIDTSLYHAVRVDREGTLLHRDHRKQQAGVLALTVGSGAAVGGVIAGVPGALVGAGIGAGVSGAVYLKQDKQAELPKNTQVIFELVRPMTLGLE